MDDRSARVASYLVNTEAYYYRHEVGNLQTLLEEVTRAKPGSAESRFVSPDHETLNRLSARFHHVLYGRRGTGKSSLLRRVELDTKGEGRLVAWADQETFKGHSYPDVLVGTLAEVFSQFADQLDAFDTSPQPLRKQRFWRKRAEPTDKQLLSQQLREAVAALNQLHKAPSTSEVEWTETFSDAVKIDAEGSVTANGGYGSLSVGGNYKRGNSSTRENSRAMAQRYSATKDEHLERALATYRRIMLAVGNQCPDSFVVLDDFYHLRRDDQPQIAGYFHRVVKDTSIWLKFGSISLWTRLYAGGNPPMGLQAPHDIRDLSLDKGLREFKNLKRFLEEILDNLCAESSVSRRDLFSDGALDRLVLASGGVPRDYIGLVGESISSAKNRGPSGKSGSDRIIAEDVNSAAGKTVETKYKDLEEDAGGNTDDLRRLVIQLTDHCRSTKSSCFLIDSSNAELVDLTNRLQNMRFVHLVATNETVPNQASDRYHVYVLDVSLLAAQRAWQVDFMGWVKRESRRARKLVFDPTSAVALPTPGPRPDVELDDSLAVIDEIDP